MELPGQTDSQGFTYSLKIINWSNKGRWKYYYSHIAIIPDCYEIWHSILVRAISHLTFRLLNHSGSWGPLVLPVKQ